MQQQKKKEGKTKVKTAVIIKKCTEIIYIFVFSWTIAFRNEPLDHSKHRHSLKKKNTKKKL